MFLEFIKSIALILILLATLTFLGIFLYKTVEYIEDKTFAAKVKIEQIIITISCLHILLIFRRVSFFLVIYSLVIQGIFYNLLQYYPNIQPSNPNFIIGSLMALGNHFLMLRSMILGNNYLVEMVLIFIVIVWCTPFCFFLSLSANDEALPVKGKKTNTWIGKMLGKVLNK